MIHNARSLDYLNNNYYILFDLLFCIMKLLTILDGFLHFLHDSILFQAIILHRHKAFLFFLPIPLLKQFPLVNIQQQPPHRQQTV